MFDTADGPVSLDDLSDGYQNVAAWVGDLLYRTTGAFDDFSNPLATRGLLLLDEIVYICTSSGNGSYDSSLKTNCPSSKSWRPRIPP